MLRAAFARHTGQKPAIGDYSQEVGRAYECFRSMSTYNARSALLPQPVASAWHKEA
jgi:hypothetical protein